MDRRISVEYTFVENVLQKSFFALALQALVGGFEEVLSISYCLELEALNLMP
jgi:hypothetical protein